MSQITVKHIEPPAQYGCKYPKKYGDIYRAIEQAAYGDWLEFDLGEDGNSNACRQCVCTWNQRRYRLHMRMPNLRTLQVGKYERENRNAKTTTDAQTKEAIRANSHD